MWFVCRALSVSLIARIEIEQLWRCFRVFLTVVNSVEHLWPGDQGRNLRITLIRGRSAAVVIFLCENGCASWSMSLASNSGHGLAVSWCWLSSSRLRYEKQHTPVTTTMLLPVNVSSIQLEYVEVGSVNPACRYLTLDLRSHSFASLNQNRFHIHNFGIGWK